MEDCEGLCEVVFEQKSEASDEISHAKSWGGYVYNFLILNNTGNHKLVWNGL